MKFFDYLRLLLCVLLFSVVSLLLARDAHAGRFARLVSITVATDDGQVVEIPASAISVDPAAPLLGKIAATPVSTVRRATRTVVVCTPEGCKEVEVPVNAADADCINCECVDCQCATPAALAASAANEHSILHRSEQRFMDRGPVRKLFGRIFQGAKNFNANRPRIFRSRCN